ncbi:MAG: HU family DNA-binding protein [Myxococcales bacterium]|nr:HU family DNA-binding protein [Myxococcales bacterium]
MANLNKSDLINELAARAALDKKDVEKVMDSFFEIVVSKTKAGDKVAWPGFGSFATSARAARKGRNPVTKEEINIPASTAMKFSAAKALKDALNG